MLEQLMKEVRMLMEDDGRVIHQFYEELRKCMEEEDVKVFDEFFKQLIERREVRVRNITWKLEKLQEESIMIG